MSVPWWAWWSKPQNVRCNARSSLGPTGQPECQLLPSDRAVTCELCQLNGGCGCAVAADRGAAACCWTAAGCGWTEATCGRGLTTELCASLPPHPATTLSAAAAMPAAAVRRIEDLLPVFVPLA